MVPTQTAAKNTLALYTSTKNGITDIKSIISQITDSVENASTDAATAIDIANDSITISNNVQTIIQNATYNVIPNTLVKRDNTGSISANNISVENITVSGSTVLGNESTDTIKFVGKTDSMLNMNNNDINNVGNLTINGSTKIGNNSEFTTIGFFGKEPVVQQWANDATELLIALKNMGLIKSNV
jgi:hypothetical protein